MFPDENMKIFVGCSNTITDRLIISGGANSLILLTLPSSQHCQPCSQFLIFAPGDGSGSDDDWRKVDNKVKFKVNRNIRYTPWPRPSCPPGNCVTIKWLSRDVTCHVVF